jgi:short subunit dehydrogenase-like uncharacterized protein
MAQAVDIPGAGARTADIQAKARTSIDLQPATTEGEGDSKRLSGQRGYEDTTARGIGSTPGGIM